jgi:hypothetical protein
MCKNNLACTVTVIGVESVNHMRMTPMLANTCNEQHETTR